MSTEKQKLLLNLIRVHENESDDDDDFDDVLWSSSSSSSSDESSDEENQWKDYNFIEVVDLYSNFVFKSHFRLERRTVDFLIEKYSQSHLFDGVNNGKKKISPKAQVYMYVWYISSNTITFRQLAVTFKVAKNTACKVIRRVTSWIVSIGHDFLQWPSGSTVEETARKFEEIKGIPGVIGAIDCTHISINAPTIGKECFFDRKKQYSIVLQAVVDADKRFTSLYCGDPGSLHDSRVLRRSSLFSEVQNNGRHLFPNGTFLLGDSAYTSSNWIVTPFKDNGHLTPLQRRFNTIHSSTRIFVENAFGLLKGRFRRLCYRYRYPSCLTQLEQKSDVNHNLKNGC